MKVSRKESKTWMELRVATMVRANRLGGCNHTNCDEYDLAEPDWFPKFEIFFITTDGGDAMTVAVGH
jgi:hypothetical protein